MTHSCSTLKSLRRVQAKGSGGAKRRGLECPRNIIVPRRGSARSEGCARSLEKGTSRGVQAKGSERFSERTFRMKGTSWRVQAKPSSQLEASSSTKFVMRRLRISSARSSSVKHWRAQDTLRSTIDQSFITPRPQAGQRLPPPECGGKAQQSARLSQSAAAQHARPCACFAATSETRGWRGPGEGLWNVQANGSGVSATCTSSKRGAL